MKVAEGRSGGGGGPRKNRVAGQDGDDSDGMKSYRVGTHKLREAIGRGLKSGSYIPKIGRIMDLLDKRQAKEFHCKYTDGGTPVYICAVTNNRGDFGTVTENAYKKLVDDGIGACVGTWTDDDGTVYSDTSMIFSGTRMEEALRFKKKYNQTTIMVIDRNGNSAFV